MGIYEQPTEEILEGSASRPVELSELEGSLRVIDLRNLPPYLTEAIRRRREDTTLNLGKIAVLDRRNENAGSDYWF